MGTNSRNWTMPEWMEPYRGLFENTGGQSVEDLVNTDGKNAGSNVVNPVLAAMAVSVESQVMMLARLRSNGFLYSHEDMLKTSRDAINLLLEYRDKHGYDEERAEAQALVDVGEGTSPATLMDIEEMREWQASGEGGA